MIVNWYSVPIWRSTVEPSVVQELQEYALKQEYAQKPEWASHKLSDPSFASNCIQDLKKTLTEVKINVNEYLNAVDSDPAAYTVTSSWFTLTEQGEYAHIHSHMGTDISGVIYVSAEPDQGEIFFPRPFDQISMTAWLRHLPDHWAHQPSTGDILLFPSWLAHGVRTNTTSAQRRSFSWNGIVHK